MVDLKKLKALNSDIEGLNKLKLQYEAQKNVLEGNLVSALKEYEELTGKAFDMSNLDVLSKSIEAEVNSLSMSLEKEYDNANAILNMVNSGDFSGALNLANNLVGNTSAVSNNSAVDSSVVANNETAKSSVFEGVVAQQDLANKDLATGGTSVAVSTEPVSVSLDEPIVTPINLDEPIVSPINLEEPIVAPINLEEPVSKAVSVDNTGLDNLVGMDASADEDFGDFSSILDDEF